MLREPSKLDAQRRQLARLVDTVREPGASDRAAELALSLLRQ
jgi:hypothetical protein